MARVDDLVVQSLLDRFSQPDALALLAPPEDDANAETRAEIAELSRRLDGIAAEYVEGRLTASMLSKIESDLNTKIEAAQRKLRSTAVIPTEVYDLIASGAIGEMWEDADLALRRATITSLMSVVVKPSSLPRGSRRFNPDDIEIVWHY